MQQPGLRGDHLHYEIVSITSVTRVSDGMKSPVATYRHALLAFMHVSIPGFKERRAHSMVNNCKRAHSLEDNSDVVYKPT